MNIGSYIGSYVYTVKTNLLFQSIRLIIYTFHVFSNTQHKV